MWISSNFTNLSQLNLSKTNPYSLIAEKEKKALKFFWILCFCCSIWAHESRKRAARAGSSLLSKLFHRRRLRRLSIQKTSVPRADVKPTHSRMRASTACLVALLAPFYISALPVEYFYGDEQQPIEEGAENSAVFEQDRELVSFSFLF